MSARRALTRRDRPDELEAAYALTLQEYLRGGGETALRKAYELGRSAMADGHGLLEVVAVHHAALNEVLMQPGVTDLLKQPDVLGRLRRVIDRGREFLAEAISPYEMAQRGFGEALQALRRLNETLEGEIQRLAHDVHDQAGQLLVAARLALSEVAHEAPEARGGVAKVTTILDRAERELRRISHELRPLVLDDLGLEPAIQLLADGAGRRSRPTVHLENAMGGRPGRRVETVVYRVVQEALVNAARHGHARHVWIRLVRKGKTLSCHVRDDGVGFTVAEVMARPGRKGLGLLGIRERLHAVGGTLRVQGGPGRGTELIARIPWEA